MLDHWDKLTVQTKIKLKILKKRSAKRKFSLLISLLLFQLKKFGTNLDQYSSGTLFFGHFAFDVLEVNGNVSKDGD